MNKYVYESESGVLSEERAVKVDSIRQQEEQMQYSSLVLMFKMLKAIRL